MKQYWFVARRKEDGIIQFEAPMKVTQCKGKTLEGSRCQRKICLSYPYCWQHTKVYQRLTVKASAALASIGVSGQKGLYAHQPDNPKIPVFFKDEPIVKYQGERLHDDKLELRYQYPDAPHGVVMSPYAMELDDEWSIDAALLRGVAAYANSPVGTGKKSNARLEVDETGRYPTAWLVASRNIYHDQEILTQYGRDYFKLSCLNTQIVQRQRV